jgi:hypothetical protein
MFFFKYKLFALHITIIILISFQVEASEYKSILSFKKNSHLIIPKSKNSQKGNTIKLYVNEEVIGDGFIKICKSKSCLVKYKVSNKKINLKQLTYKEIVKTPKKEKVSTNKDQSLYFGVGGPLTNSFVIEYNKNMERFSFSINYGQMLFPLNKLILTGSNLEIGSSYSFYKTEKSSLFIKYLLGYSSGSLDFTNIDSNGHKEDISFTSHSIGLGIDFNVFSDINIQLTAGQSSNSIKKEYTNEFNEIYSVPDAESTVFYSFLLGIKF